MPCRLGYVRQVLGRGLLAALFFALLWGTPPPAAAEAVIIFHAGSLTVPLAALEKEFEARHPELEVLREAGGSSQCARMISELHRPCDLMAAADFAVIDRMLIPTEASWNILFATNQMVLCYTPASAYAAEIGPHNWTEILARPGVNWGHSDPNLDPCGYSALMVLQLAEKLLGRPGLAARLTAARPEANIRPKAVELLALLESGVLDYAWEYRSVAVQHGLEFVALPDKLNLGNPAEDEFYRQAQVEVNGKKPGERILLQGKSITYGVTLLDRAPQPQAALRFLDFLLDPEGGLKILAAMGQPPLSPPRLSPGSKPESLPAKLRARPAAGGR
ncbi:MAG TPA: tungstate ABC transporter substrate-binding protein WtpA [Proteobacteria bacterium]|nr:tungstate ABC transporter substrate-binding protein WtpA [Pseudomonadota bacterium]